MEAGKTACTAFGFSVLRKTGDSSVFLLLFVKKASHVEPLRFVGDRYMGSVR